MPTHDSPHSSRQAADRKVPRRPPEVDQFVDRFLTVVCDTSRRYILELLAAEGDEDETTPVELRSGDIAKALELSASTTSEHLHQLTALRLIVSRKEGNAVYYRLHNRMLVRAFHDLLLALDRHYASRRGGEELD